MPSTALPSSLYTGGNVVLNSQPYVNYFLNQAAKEQAKNEALDRYFMDYDKNINPAGMRNQEVEPLMQQLKDNKDFYFKNRDKILNPSKDNGAAYTEYNARNRAALGFVSQSKEQAAKDKLLNEHVYQAKQKGLSIPDSVIHQIELSQLPVNNPNFKSVDPYDLQFDKPFDVKQFQGNTWAGLTPSTKTIQSRQELDAKGKPTGRLIDVQQTYLDPSDYAAIEQRAASEYNSKPEVKKFIDNLAQTDLPKLNQIYKAAHGQNIDIQHPEQAAAAYALSLGDIGKTKESEPKTDALYMYKLAEADRQKRQNQRLAAQSQKQGDVSDAINKVIQDARTGEMFEGKEGLGLEKLNFKPIIANDYQDQRTKTVPDFAINPTTGKVFAVTYQKENGRPTKLIDWTKSYEIPEYQLRSTIANKVLPSQYKTKAIVNAPNKVPIISNGKIR